MWFCVFGSTFILLITRNLVKLSLSVLMKLLPFHYHLWNSCSDHTSSSCLPLFMGTVCFCLPFDIVSDFSQSINTDLWDTSESETLCDVNYSICVAAGRLCKRQFNVQSACKHAKQFSVFIVFRNWIPDCSGTHINPLLMMLATSGTQLTNSCQTDITWVWNMLPATSYLLNYYVHFKHLLKVNCLTGT